jgi:predicted dinucleotide-binding enzyme
MKKIGIIGSGAVARALAAGFVNTEYDVMMGTRDPSKLSDIDQVKSGSVAETIQFSDLLVLAVKGSAAVAVLTGHQLDGKTIIDTTNPVADLPPVNGVLQFFTAPNHSLGEDLQKNFPTANFVKAFNSVGSSSMVNPSYKNERPTMFICGNNPDSKSVTTEILTRFGWETEDLGQIEACRAIEPLCILWCIPGFLRNSWTHAFKLLKK